MAISTAPSSHPRGGDSSPPLISVIILNYNGLRWLERCLGSLRAQTIFRQLQIIVADNASADGSAQLAAKLMGGWDNGRLIRHERNLGYCEGNNRAATGARGKYLLFLNNDVWLEPSCLEVLVATVERMNAQAGAPLTLDYADDVIQSSGAAGFDPFGLLSLESPHEAPREVFAVGGYGFLILRKLFERIGGFDPAFYMYADDYDLSWRVWIAGAAVALVPAARLHHRGSAIVSPAGGERLVEFRTSDTKRYYTNRNCLLVLLKNAQHILFLAALLQVVLLLVEACVSLALLRRWLFVKRAYLDAFAGCFTLRRHVCAQRRRIASFRRRNDWHMLRFLRWRLNRWDELRKIMRHGVPKVTAS